MIVKPKKQRTPKDQVWVNQIKNKVKSLAFGSCKFIRNEAKSVCATGRIFDKWNLKEFEGLTGKALKDARATWVQNNKEGVREGHLVHHNFVQGQVRDLVVSMVMHGEEVPTPNQILMCATRDIKLREQANHWIFVMHWDGFLPRLLGETFWAGQEASAQQDDLQGHH